MFEDYINYIKDNPQGYWFKNKIYGWGWVPARWQGWIVIAIYLILIFLFGLTIDEQSPKSEIAFAFILPTAILTAMLLRICYKTGEKPSWQWGIPKKPNGQ